MNVSINKRIAHLEHRQKKAQSSGVVVIYNPNIPGDWERLLAGVGEKTSSICIPDNGRPRAGIGNHIGDKE